MQLHPRLGHLFFEVTESFYSISLEWKVEKGLYQKRDVGGVL